MIYRFLERKDLFESQLGWLVLVVLVVLVVVEH
jgi:hypothetical protein